MPTYPPAPPGPSEGRRALLVLGVVFAALVVVVGVLGVVVTSRESEDDPASGTVLPPPDPSPSGDAALQEAFDQVAALRQVSAGFTSSFEALSEQYQSRLAGPQVVAAEEAFAEARATYEGALAGLDGLPALAAPGVRAAYDAFATTARSSLRYGDDFLAVRRSLLACQRPLQVSILDADAHRVAAARCRRELAPMRDSPFPMVADYARDFTTLMRRRQEVYDRPIDPDTFDGAAVGAELGAAYDDLSPAVDALTTGGGLAALAEQVSVSTTYPELYAVLEDEVAAGS